MYKKIEKKKPFDFGINRVYWTKMTYTVKNVVEEKKFPSYSFESKLSTPAAPTWPMHTHATCLKGERMSGVEGV